MQKLMLQWFKDGHFIIQLQLEKSYDVMRCKFYKTSGKDDVVHFYQCRAFELGNRHHCLPVRSKVLPIEACISVCSKYLIKKQFTKILKIKI